MLTPAHIAAVDGNAPRARNVRLCRLLAVQNRQQELLLERNAKQRREERRNAQLCATYRCWRDKDGCHVVRGGRRMQILQHKKREIESRLGRVKKAMGGPMSLCQHGNGALRLCLVYTPRTASRQVSLFCIGHQKSLSFSCGGGDGQSSLLPLQRTQCLTAFH